MDLKSNKAMKYDLIIDSRPSEVVIALLRDGLLIELHKEKHDNNFSVGDIYLGKVRKINPGLNASFVNVGYEKDGFLHYLDLGPQFNSYKKFTKQAINKKLNTASLKNFRKEPNLNKDGVINDALKGGEVILTQISKEPISTKGPRLTTEISIAGRYMILIPFSDKVSISQKIEDQKEQKRLKQLIRSIKPHGFGVIIRTVALGKKVADLDKDLKNLYKKWQGISKKLKDAKPNTRIYGELNKASVILRDLLNAEFNSIYVNNTELQIELKEYISRIAPDKEKIVKLHKKDTQIFQEFNVTKQIKGAFGKNVNMKKGTYLVIEHTEALHVIDVNSGNRSNKSRDQEDTALEVNIIAATEIARQLRLRDMGGIIVVDFIDMTSNTNRKKLFEHLKDEMNQDRTKHKILPPSRFGLIQITRQRVRPEMKIKTKEANPNSNGEVEAPIVLIDKINTELNNIVKKKQYKSEQVYLHVHPFVASYLKEGFPSIQVKWYFEYKKWVRIVPRDAFLYLKYSFVDKNQKKLQA